jgi:hypothetical protein
MDNEQVASPASAESPSSNVESNQQRLDSMGEDGSFFAGRYFDLFELFCWLMFFCLVYQLKLYDV